MDKKNLMILAKYLVPGMLSVFLLGMCCGWLLKRNDDLHTDGKILRLDGYTFVRPLLACNDSGTNLSLFSQGIKNHLETLIQKRKNLHAVDAVSVFYKNYENNESFIINPEEKFFPASLNKIPILITALKMAEEDPQWFSKTLKLELTADANENLEIKPKEKLILGNEYAIEEVLEKLVKFSDNNAFYLLTQNLDVGVYEKIHEDLKIPFSRATNDKNYVSVDEFSYFLRVLYNGTYLDRESSEKALKLLSEVDYNNGLVAGVSDSVPVAHKFGLLTDIQTSVTQRQLHDCGIIYAPQSPYLLCVMTKSSAELSMIEETLRDISQVVYGTLATGANL